MLAITISQLALLVDQQFLKSCYLSTVRWPETSLDHFLDMFPLGSERHLNLPPCLSDEASKGCHQCDVGVPWGHELKWQGKLG
jgi:hypothetical protein